MQNIKKECPILSASEPRGQGGKEYEKSVKDIESLTLIQSQFFDCAPLLSGGMEIFSAIVTSVAGMVVNCAAILQFSIRPAVSACQ